MKSGQYQEHKMVQPDVRLIGRPRSMSVTDGCRQRRCPRRAGSVALNSQSQSAGGVQLRGWRTRRRTGHIAVDIDGCPFAYGRRFRQRRGASVPLYHQSLALVQATVRRQCLRPSQAARHGITILPCAGIDRDRYEPRRGRLRESLRSRHAYEGKCAQVYLKYLTGQDVRITAILFSLFLADILIMWQELRPGRISEWWSVERCRPSSSGELDRAKSRPKRLSSNFDGSYRIARSNLATINKRLHYLLTS